MVSDIISRYPDIDVTIDGADEVDPQLNAIKGGGACQFQEKVVAEAAKKFVIVAGKVLHPDLWDVNPPLPFIDYRKKSTKLGVEVRKKDKRSAPCHSLPSIVDKGGTYWSGAYGL